MLSKLYNYRQLTIVVFAIFGARSRLKQPSFTNRRIYRYSRSLNTYINNTNPPDVEICGSGDDCGHYRSDYEQHMHLVQIRRMLFLIIY